MVERDQANAASSSANPNSWAVGQTETMSAVVAPGRTRVTVWSMYSRQRCFITASTPASEPPRGGS
ncbi:MAG TPA: hypothetical protein VH021_20645 [Trebonia sp.]|nr:hypothetical protein [Trebonia sp.]